MRHIEVTRGNKYVGENQLLLEQKTHTHTKCLLTILEQNLATFQHFYHYQVEMVMMTTLETSKNQSEMFNKNFYFKFGN